MDHIKWDSDVCDEYSAGLKKGYIRLEDEIQNLSNARKNIQAFNSEASDRALEIILLRLEKKIVRLKEVNERIRKLQSAVDEANTIFSRAEAHIGSIGTELLYTSITGSAQYGEKSPLVSTIHNRFQSNEIHPQWLHILAEKSLK